MNKSKISIVIPCYNAADSIYTTWGSIKRQTYGIENIEAIFVDDASTDDGATLSKLMEIEQEAPQSVIVIPSEKNGGPGGAVNSGIEYASGDYLQIVGADDELADDAMEKLYAIAVENDTDIIQYNHTLILNGNRKVNMVSVGNKLICIDDHDSRISFLNATSVTYGCTNKFYKMDLIRSTGVKFAENVVYEEPLFVYPLFLYAKRVYFYEEGLYYYYLHPNSIVTSKIGKKILDHPKVQLMVLADCMNRTELYEEYKDVIACYFLWSYYCETLFFAVENPDSILPLNYFTEMQNVCKKLFPDWRDNPQIRRTSKETIQLLESIDKTFTTQNELDKFIHEVKELGF